MIVTVNGITATVHQVKNGNELTGYTVTVGGQDVGNRIDRRVDDDGAVSFASVARNERLIDERETLHEAVADVLNDGMRDRARR